MACMNGSAWEVDCEEDVHAFECVRRDVQGKARQGRETGWDSLAHYASGGIKQKLKLIYHNKASNFHILIFCHLQMKTETYFR